MKQLDKHVYGPWALVNSASSGIGEEFARQVVASGINVVLLARREVRLHEAEGMTGRTRFASPAGRHHPGPNWSNFPDVPASGKHP